MRFVKGFSVGREQKTAIFPSGAKYPVPAARDAGGPGRPRGSDRWQKGASD